MLYLPNTRSCLSSLQPTIDFLDTRISWFQVRKGDFLVWQFSMSAYSTPTDAHAYLSPTSCTAPHFKEEGVSVAKTVGARLRSIHSSDSDLLNTKFTQPLLWISNCKGLSGEVSQVPAGLHGQQGQVGHALWPV